MSLRLVEAIAPTEICDAWESSQEDIEIVGVWKEELTQEISVLRILVRSEKTDPLISKISQHMEHYHDFRLMIFEVEATLPHVEEKELEEKEDNGKEESGEKTKDPLRIACAELVQKLQTGAVVNRIYILTVILSTVVAAVGLMKANVAVIIGAMVIAPLLSPNMTLSLGTTLGDLKLIKGALYVNGVGIAIAFALSCILGYFLPVDPMNPEISSRLSVGLSDVVLALAAGSAGALAFTTGISSAVVGVMVAVALLPPLATTGLMVGSGYYVFAGEALLLTTTNIICINIAGVATFLFQDVRPNFWWEAERAKRMVRKAVVIWIVLLLIWLGLIYLASKYGISA